VIRDEVGVSTLWIQKLRPEVSGPCVRKDVLNRLRSFVDLLFRVTNE
jgi:hypothetical protein